MTSRPLAVTFRGSDIYLPRALRSVRSRHSNAVVRRNVTLKINGKKKRSRKDDSRKDEDPFFSPPEPLAGLQTGGRDLRQEGDSRERRGGGVFWDTAETDKWLSQLALVVEAILLGPQTAPVND